MITLNKTPNNNIAFGALIPKKDYTGPILKLTKKEQAKVDEYYHKIGELELEKAKLCDLRQKNIKNNSNWEYYVKSVSHTTDKISYYQDQITKIKTERLAKQKAKLEANATKKALDIEG